MWIKDCTTITFNKEYFKPNLKIIFKRKTNSVEKTNRRPTKI
jgi:hypothetical protein